LRETGGIVLTGLLIIFLVPQFMFAGSILPLSTFGPAGKLIRNCTVKVEL